MDFLAENSTLSLWLLQYGSFALFGLLAAGIIAIPIPEESLMIAAGVLMKNENLHTMPTIFAALGGSICGITVSYLLGSTAGHFLFHKYGKWVGITPIKLKKAHEWFEKYGTWGLCFGYFVPGLRHFTGFCAGTTDLEIGRFALFAYVGAFLWVSTFLSVGYFFGDYCIALFT